MESRIRFSENIQEAFDAWLAENRPPAWRTTISSADINPGWYSYATTAEFTNGTQWIDTSYRPNTTQNGLYGNLIVDDLVDYEEDTGTRYWQWSFDPVNMTFSVRSSEKSDELERSEELDAFLDSFKIIKNEEDRE